MKPERVYYFDTPLAGRLYGDADKAWEFLRVGREVELRREHDNPADPYAIAVYFAGDDSEFRLGYIPMARNQLLAVMADMGWGEAFRATISRLDPAAPYDSQIHITVRIVRREEAADEETASTPEAVCDEATEPEHDTANVADAADTATSETSGNPADASAPRKHLLRWISRSTRHDQ